MFALLRLTRLEHVPPTSITLCSGAEYNLFATSTTTGLNPWQVLGRKFGTTSASKSSEGKKKLYRKQTERTEGSDIIIVITIDGGV